jgi:VanZ family protein
MTSAADAWRHRLRWLPALAWMAVIFLLSSQGDLRVSEDAGTEKPIRIVAHLATFALLGGLILVAICGRRAPSGRAVVGAVALTTLYALSDELHQALVPGRTGRIDDVVIDLVGALVGAALAAVLLATLGRAASANELERGHLDAERQHS